MSISLWNDPFFGNPWKEFDQLRRDMDKVFNNYAVANPERSNALWKPLTDVKETDKDVIMHLELPGIKKEDINIELKDGVLSVSGERRHEKKEENERWHRTERTFGSFRRQMVLPEGVTESDIKASYNDGVLELSFPKPQPKVPETKKITIA
jgi:HSP20 family protein